VPAPDAASFRDTLGHYVTGVVVVSALTTQGPVGFTCQTFGALSLEPLLVSFAAGVDGRSWPLVRDVGVIGVSVLGVEQEPVARAMGRSGVDKFEDVAWSPGPQGSPLITGSVAHVEGLLDSWRTEGDHDIAVVRVHYVIAHGGPPLVFYRGRFGGLG
jgi:flavin reductase (DIM6/NTAB) family NADH-FMN oxidoreductase RutF